MKNYKHTVLHTLTACILCLAMLITAAGSWPANAAGSFVSPTDPSDATVPLIPPLPDAGVQATGTQIKNIAVDIKINANNVNTLSFYVDTRAFATQKTALQFFERGAESANQLSVSDKTEMTRTKSGVQYHYLDVMYTPSGTQSSGSRIMFCGYNSTDTAANALAHISTDVESGSYTTGIGISSYDESVLSVTKAYLGDITGDGAVNATDMLRCQQAVAGSYTLTDAQRLAADVNRDGVVNAVDAMKISQYASQSLLSFWSTDTIVDIPSGTVSGISNDHMYRLKNVSTQQYWGCNATTHALAYTSSPATASNFESYLRVGYSGGFVTFRNSEGQYLLLNASYQTVFAGIGSANTIASSCFWRPVAVTGGFQFVNYAVPHRMLNTQERAGSCFTDRAVYGNVWALQELTIQLNYYFDQAYLVRHPNAASDLQNKQSKIKTIIESVFGVKVNINTPAKHTSYGDMCFASDSAITLSAIADQTNTVPCGHVSGTDHGDENCINNTSAGTLSTTRNTASLMHHNSSVAMMRRLNSIYTNHTSILLLTSGHSPCSIDKNTHDHEIRAIAGQALPVWRVGGVWHSDNGNDYKDSITALHEISHCLGAYGNDSLADSNHGNCVMSYNRHNPTLVEWFGSNTVSDYNQLYCSNCLDDIKQYLYAWK